ncbi:MAG: hypothetical protein AVDCRST_MAG16-403 [uncultured Frankineae bacterium]|uniref:Uncharacterized protein n=1 Tax=uncultured Frankineae bacterium TaxID=437475 RepID=A0A6J4KVB8_9ACTN|nr:MAG: hypothetical protein AVDCRST_MAG16-403 [uncultured Frankineae bacterium]
MLVHRAVGQHDVRHAGCVQLGDGVRVGCQHDDPGARCGGREHARDARGLLRQVVTHDDGTRVRRSCGLEHRRLGRVTPHDPQPGVLRLRGAVGGQGRHDHVDAGAGQLLRHVPGGPAPARDEHVPLRRRGVDRGLAGPRGRRAASPLQTARRGAAARGQPGRGDQEQDRRGDEGLRPVLPEPRRGEADLAPETLQDEGELAHLRQQQAGARRGRRADPGGQRGADRGDRLDDEHERHGGQHEQRLLEQEADVEQGPDRQEEGRGEQDLQRQHLAQRVRRVTRLADDQPGEEGAQRHRDPGQGGQVGGAQAQRDDREQEDLGRARPGDGLQHRGHHPARDHERDRDDRRGGRESADQSAGPAAVPVAEHRQQEHHRHDGEVLEDQQSQARLAGRRAGGAAVGEQLEHDGGRGQRDEQAGEQRRAQVDTGQHEHAGDHGDRAEHLQRPAEQHQPADRHQPADGELDADREQQQDDADLGGGVDHLALADDGQRVRADQHARQQEADDRHDAQPGADVADHRPGHHQRRDLRQELRRSLSCGQQHSGPLLRRPWSRQACHRPRTSRRHRDPVGGQGLLHERALASTG